jgi:hypothetical protein
MQFEKYRRFVEPLSSFVLCIIAVAISSRKVRGGVGLPLGIGIFICLRIHRSEPFRVGVCGKRRLSATDSGAYS